MRRDFKRLGLLSLSARRAWIEIKYVVKDSDFAGSLSARRAWIEIHVRCFSPAGCWVALRKESVDRNLGTVQIVIIVVESLSARRAWIEISTRSQPSRPRRVALRKESVDRNRECC